MTLFRTAALFLTLLAVPAVAQTTARPTATAPAPNAKPPVINTAPAPSLAATRVDVNSASAEQLDSLPGVGASRAKLIMANRPYANVQDLVAKKALTQKVLDGAKDRIALANINTTSAKDLAAVLPGIGDVRAKAIVDGRPYANPGDLVTKNVLTPALFDKIKDLVTN